MKIQANHKSRETIFDLEKIVPSLRSCKKIPDGFFRESALVWAFHPAFIPGDAEDGIIVPRGFCKSSDVIAPAPAMQEILVDFPEIAMSSVQESDAGGVSEELGYVGNDNNVRLEGITCDVDDDVFDIALRMECNGSFSSSATN